MRAPQSSLMLAFALSLVGTAALADDDAALAKKRDEKLAEPWVKADGWIADYEKALGEARKSGKPILAYFTVSSDASPPCQKFERTLGDAKAAELGKSYVLFLHVTSHVKKDKHQDLLAKKGGKGFPYVVWLDADGNVVSDADSWEFQDPPARSIAGLDETGKRVKWYLDVKKKASGGGNPEKVDLALAELEMDKAKLADVEKRIAGLGPSNEQKAALEALRSREEIKPTVEKLRKGAGFEDLCAAGKKFIEMRKAGKPAPQAGPSFEFFWRCILLDARKEKDAASFEEGLKALKARFGDSTGSSLYFHVGQETWKTYLEEMDKSLEQLKKPPAPPRPSGGD